MVEATQMNSHDSGEGYETSTLPCRTVARHVQSGKYVCGSNTSVGSVNVSVNLPLTRTGTGSPTDGREAQCEPSWSTRDTRAMHSSAAGASMRRCSIPTMSPRGTWCGFGARVLIALFARGGRRTRRSFRSRSSRRRSCVGGRGQPAACAAGRSSSGPGSPASGRISCVVSFADLCDRKMQAASIRQDVYYRCLAKTLAPGSLMLADHPRTVNLREDHLVRPLNAWIGGLFRPDNLDNTSTRPRASGRPRWPSSTTCRSRTSCARATSGRW